MVWGDYLICPLLLCSIVIALNQSDVVVCTCCVHVDGCPGGGMY